MATKTYKGEDFTVSYEDNQQVRDAVFEKVIEFYTKHEAYSGESIMQCDNPMIDAPAHLSDIADDILKFDVECND